MKWMTPLWRDPITWSEKMAGTKHRIVVFALVHLMMALFGMFVVYTGAQYVSEGSDPMLSPLTVFIIGSGPVVIWGVLCPVAYLYAIHMLLRALKNENRQNLSLQE